MTVVVVHVDAAGRLELHLAQYVRQSGFAQPNTYLGSLAISLRREHVNNVNQN